MPLASRLRTAVLLGGAFLGLRGASAQTAPSWDVRAWTTEDGLPVNFVMGLAQTADGFLWIATGEGLVRFDGLRFETFTGRDLGWTTSFVNDVHADGRGRLWTASSTGEVSVRRADGRFALVVPARPGRTGSTTFIPDSSGGLWCPFGDGSVLHVPARGRRQLYAPVAALGTVRGVSVDLDGAVWWVGERRAARFDGRRFVPVGGPLPDGAVWIHENGEPLAALPSGRVVALDRGRWTARPGLTVAPTWLEPGSHWPAVALDRAGTRWVFTGGRMERHRPGRPTERFDATADFPPYLGSEAGPVWVGTDGRLAFGLDGEARRVRLPDGLEPLYLTARLDDADGTVWVGTDVGLVRIRRDRVAAFTPADGLSGRLVFPILHASDGSTWLGTFGGGLTRRAPDGRVTTIRAADGLVSDFVRTLFEDTDGRLWAGTHNAFSVVEPSGRVVGTFRPDSTDGIATFARTPDGTLWMGGDRLYRVRGTPERGLRFEPATARPFHAPVLRVAPDGRLWAGGRDGVFRQDGRAWRRVAGPRPGFQALTVEPDGTLWTSGTDGALRRLDPDGRPTVYGPAEGFDRGGAWSVTPDGRGHVWTSGNSGILRIPRASLDAVADARAAGRPARLAGIVHLAEADGMPSAECNTGRPSVARDRAGRLWFPTIRGAAIVDPARFQTHERPPHVVVESISVNGIEQPGLPRTLDAGTRNVAFTYTATSLADAARTRFRYRLYGVDRAWVDAGTRREVHYAGLGPGRHTFRVQAANADGVWSPVGAAYAFAVAPFWWQTGWAATLGVLGVLALVAGGFRVRETFLRTVELDRLVDARTAALRAAQATSAAQAEQLQTLDRAKSRFLANVSHEFGTPLTLVLGPAEDTLGGKHGDVSPAARHALGVIRENALRLRALAGQLLELARLEAGRLPFKPAPGDAVRLAEAAARAALPLAERQDVQLLWDLPAAPVPLVFDGAHLLTALGNVLGNAVKFTPARGLVRLTLDVLPDAVAFVVRDTGPGILAGDLPRVLDRFYQAETSAAVEGSGIGLALARELVEMHGGRVEAESEAGFGATFRLVLPRPALPDGPLQTDFGPTGCASAEAHDAEPAEPDGDGRPLVLVVDDHPDVRRLVAGHLAGPFRTALAADGDEALALARAERPAAIVSDVMMPGTDGLALLAALRADPDLAAVPVLLLSARSGPDAAAEALAAGADDYVEKPYSARLLVARVARLIAAPRPRHSVAPDVPALATPDENLTERLREAIAASLDLPTFHADDLAFAVGMSTATLNRRLKKMGRAPAAALLRDTRLDHAAALLRTGAVLVKEAAARVGYRDLDHFSKLFKARFGVPPSAFPPADGAPSPGE